MRQLITSIVEVLALALVFGGAAAVVVGVAHVSTPLAFIVAGVEGVCLGVGGLRISGRVSR